MERVLLDYGSGGKASHRLIGELFLKYLGNEVLDRLDDAALLHVSSPISMSTDTFTVDPIFFPGGDIGSLAVHGTVNDVAMLGARPKYMTCGFIIEEGLPMADLERIVESMGNAAREAGILVVSGDTKVVPKGTVDKIFINDIMFIRMEMGHDLVNIDIEFCRNLCRAGAVAFNQLSHFKNFVCVKIQAHSYSPYGK